MVWVVSFPMLMLRAGLGALAVHGAGGAGRLGRGAVQPFEQATDAVAHAALRVEGAASFGSLGRLRRLFYGHVRRALPLAAVHAEAVSTSDLDAVREKLGRRFSSVWLSRR